MVRDPNEAEAHGHLLEERRQQGQERAWPIAGRRAARVDGAQGRRASVRKQVTCQIGTLCLVLREDEGLAGLVDGNGMSRVRTLPEVPFNWILCDSEFQLQGPGC